MVEASNSLERLLFARYSLIYGYCSFQVIAFLLQSIQKGDYTYYAPFQLCWSASSYVSAFVIRKYQVNKNTARSLELFLCLSVLVTGVNLIQCFLHFILTEVLLGILIGMLEANERSREHYEKSKDDSDFTQGRIIVLIFLFFLPIPIIETLTILTPRPKFLGYGFAIYCAFFTTMFLYQLQSRSICDYAQEIDAITEEIKSESRVSELPSDSERAERRKRAWKLIGLLVLFVLYLSVIPVIAMIRKMKS